MEACFLYNMSLVMIINPDRTCAEHRAFPAKLPILCDYLLGFIIFSRGVKP